MTSEVKTRTGNVQASVEAELSANGGLLWLAPCWVPRSFLQPGKRIRLHPDDLYAYGLNRGGIDERWFASTTEAANAGREHDEGFSYVIVGNERFTLRDAVTSTGATLIGSQMWGTYGKWPVYSKFFDNMGPIPHHMHQDFDQAALVGLEGKPESYYFPAQYNNVGNNFPYTFFGLAPGTTKEDVRRCLENWNKGDNGILDLSQASRLKVGTGWLIDPRVLHAPGSFCTYEPQWGSDVFGMYQSLVEGREVPWALLVKDMPADKHQDIDFIVEQLDWDKNVDPHFKQNHYLEPIVATSGEGWVDKWVVYGLIDAKQYFSAKELTVAPGASCTISDPGAYGMLCTQGAGTVNGLPLRSPVLLRFNELSEDEYFCSADGAAAGVKFVNTSDTEPLVVLRYFGPDVHKDMPNIGDS